MMPEPDFKESNLVGVTVILIFVTMNIIYLTYRIWCE